jgi:16S rRNA (guanine966-N2)-methyltransferase
MRIIAGEWRGRRIRAPRDQSVRPTGDRAREAWMSIVHPLLPDAKVLDLFAGSGALGLEALSRGAAFCDFVDMSEASLRMVRENGALLGATPRMAVHRGDALRHARKLAPSAYDVAFADPPYKKGIAPALATLWLDHPFASILGIEHDMNEPLPGGGRTRRYGGTAITIYQLHPEVVRQEAAPG